MSLIKLEHLRVDVELQHAKPMRTTDLARELHIANSCVLCDALLFPRTGN